MRTWRKIVQTSLKRSSVPDRSHDAVETFGEVPERNAEDGTAVPRTRTK